jgi:acyl-CoA synthetase (AMP-forming)/AMP-acid ligase II
VTAAVETPLASGVLNIAERMRLMAELRPHAKAVIAPDRLDPRSGQRAYTHLTFGQLDRMIDRSASGLEAIGVRRGMRVLMLVKPSLDFFALSFALFRMGAVPVLLDPAMGRRNVMGAIAEVEPEALIGIPRAHLARVLFPRAFRSVKVSVMVGPKSRLFATTLPDVLALGSEGRFRSAATRAEDTAAILFTSGSTGAPKGAVYTHGIFDAQVRIFEKDFGIEPGEVDLSAFPLFSLFSVALGVTVIIPDMDHTKAAEVDGAKIAEAIDDQGVTYAFGSPAFWNRVVEHCESKRLTFSSLTRILMAGAPAPPSLVERLLRIMPDGGDVFTPYGATECLPITFPSGRALPRGNGTCVGRPIAGLEVRIIRITDEPIECFEQAELLGPGEIGEIVVTGPVVTKSYFRRERETLLSKIVEEGRVWHRMGDVGHLDGEGRLWFCGRKSHRVETPAGPMYTINCEAIFNAHPRVFRSALVGVGEKGRQRPVIVIECRPHQRPLNAREKDALAGELLAMARQHELTRPIETVLFHPRFPVDARHNAKIRREDLAAWAAKLLP